MLFSNLIGRSTILHTHFIRSYILTQVDLPSIERTFRHDDYILTVNTNIDSKMVFTLRKEGSEEVIMSIPLNQKQFNVYAQPDAKLFVNKLKPLSPYFPDIVEDSVNIFHDIVRELTRYWLEECQDSHQEVDKFFIEVYNTVDLSVGGGR